uniref:Uncharacterized protein n=1 Tax=Quercus lobata TaxID=97700 RepID=A0A7N2LNZ4_QUELO
MAFPSSHYFSLSLIWVSLFSSSLKPNRGRASASTHTYRCWRCFSSVSQPLVAISKALAGADRKDLLRKLPKFIYDKEKALERTRKILTEKMA